MIALGSDFDGIGGPLEMDDCSKLPLLADALRAEGFSADQVEGSSGAMPGDSLRKTCDTYRTKTRYNNDMDKNMTLEKRIAAELYSYRGQMSVYLDDLRGHTVEIVADEPFETASTIKAYILAALYLQASRGQASLEDPDHLPAPAL